MSEHVDPNDAALVPFDKDVASSEERAMIAHKLRIAGAPWREVAKAVGYNSATSAQIEVTKMLQTVGIRQLNERRQEAFDLEDDRLEELHQTYWPMAMAGSEKAADIVLKVIDKRMRLWGLDQMHTAPAAIGKQTIVISAEPEDFVRDLRLVTGES